MTQNKHAALYCTYRQHMSKYATETMVMSFVQVKHESYLALLAMGEDIVPFLLDDLDTRQGVTNEPEDWNNWRNRETFDPWVALVLLRQLVENPPIITKSMQGRLLPLCQAWTDWGRAKGCATEERKSTFFNKLRELFRW